MELALFQLSLCRFSCLCSKNTVESIFLMYLILFIIKSVLLLILDFWKLIFFNLTTLKCSKIHITKCNILMMTVSVQFRLLSTCIPMVVQLSLTIRLQNSFHLTAETLYPFNSHYIPNYQPRQPSFCFLF